jgi:hypothetical protein
MGDNWDLSEHAAFLRKREKTGKALFCSARAVLTETSSMLTGARCQRLKRIIFAF